MAQPPPLPPPTGSRTRAYSRYTGSVTQEDPMPNPSDTLLRTVLGETLQGAAARAVMLLAAFSALGAIIAWLVT